MKSDAKEIRDVIEAAGFQTSEYDSASGDTPAEWLEKLCESIPESEDKESNLIKHAKIEFKALGYEPIDQEQEDGPNKWIQENVLELLGIFAKQGHSGMSAPYCVRMFEKLANFEPLGPLTGEDWEWGEVSPGVFQNIRCGHVFKQSDRFNGQAYDIDGRIFREPDGCCYTNGNSQVPITFPYTPKSEYVDVPKEVD